MKKDNVEKNVKNFGQFLNENKSSETEVVSFLNKQRIEDKKEYRGHIPTKYNKGSEWSDFSWMVDEINMFLKKELSTSYTLRQFYDKYDYDTLDNILKSNFKSEYDYVLSDGEAPIQKKFDVDKLCKEFTDIDNEMSILLNKSDSLAKEGEGKDSWERYKELERIRFEKAKALFVGVKSDAKYDYIHDSILDDGFKFPRGYRAVVIASYYNGIMKYYNTIAVVYTPANTEYLVDVPTYGKVKIGTTYPIKKTK